jgi:signal transduction histidine kinase
MRLRLTFLYGALFIASGAVLLAITYLLVSNSWNDRLYVRGGFSPELARQFQAQSARQHAADLRDLLIQSGIALALTAVISIALGWLVASRALRPMRMMNVTIQQITARNLHQRLAVEGTRDEVKDLADTIDGLLARLDSALDAQKRFVANAAHELRTPITLERALLEETLTDRTATLASFRSVFERLLALSDQQGRLLEALLTLAGSERGLDRHEPVDLAALTGQVLVSSQPAIDRLGLRVDADLAPTPPISGHPALVERLVSNLLDNALHHNVSGGRVEIATAAAGEHAVVRVANTGPIVPADQVDRLAEPFRRHGDRTNPDDGHHGLGLSIVAAIATAHDATLTIHARPAGGLTVEVGFRTP